MEETTIMCNKKGCYAKIGGLEIDGEAHKVSCPACGGEQYYRLFTKEAWAELSRDVSSLGRPLDEVVPSAVQAGDGECCWHRDGDMGYYDTDCGGTFEFMEGDREENRAKFCPYCGGKIIENP
jgi:DNA-directed RNA polymerase subunit RPC12/RpoP